MARDSRLPIVKEETSYLRNFDTTTVPIQSASILRANIVEIKEEPLTTCSSMENNRLERRKLTPTGKLMQNEAVMKILMARLTRHWKRMKAIRKNENNDKSVHYRNVFQKIRKQHLSMKWITYSEYLVLSIISEPSLDNEN